MTLVKKEEYKGWTISVVSQETFCALFSFEITSPTGQSQQVKMGGENEARAFERAREMIDMERALCAEA